ncbi:MAG: alpha/beta hydrolase, partial [Psychromonas sp.]|nr:alpha/beta hydrolase [Psychromonas sp.]
MFRSILAVTLSGILFGCGGGGSSDGQSSNIATDVDLDPTSENCPSNMTCDFFNAPKDYYDEESEKIKIHYAVHKATDTENRIGVLVFNFGGPGGEAAYNTDWMVSKKLPAEILARFDVIGMDPRGSGQSAYAKELTECAVAASKSEGNCDSVYQAIAPYVGSNSVVKDLDLLRVELGEEKLNFFGYSYGTRLGSLYANMYPENVRAIVLDSPMTPNEENYFESVKGKITGFDQVVNYRLGNDAELKNSLLAVFNQANNNGYYTGDDGVTLSSTQLWNVFYALYSQDNTQNWPAIESGVLELLKNNNAQLLAEQEKDIFWRDNSSDDDLRSNYLFQLVTCTDEITPLSHTEIVNKAGEYDAIAPLFAGLARYWSTKCA